MAQRVAPGDAARILGAISPAAQISPGHPGYTPARNVPQIFVKFPGVDGLHDQTNFAGDLACISAHR